MLFVMVISDLPKIYHIPPVYSKSAMEQIGTNHADFLIFIENKFFF